MKIIKRYPANNKEINMERMLKTKHKALYDGYHQNQMRWLITDEGYYKLMNHMKKYRGYGIEVEQMYGLEILHTSDKDHIIITLVIMEF